MDEIEFGREEESQFGRLQLILKHRRVVLGGFGDCFHRQKEIARRYSRREKEEI